MDDDFDLRDFANVCRLFPLPKVVLFPHAVLPLHIFEPRYRQMTEDALAGDKLVTIVQLRPHGPGKVRGESRDRGGRLPRPDPPARAAARRPLQLPPAGPQAGPPDPGNPQRQALPDGRGRDPRGSRGPSCPKEPRRRELIALFRRVFQRARDARPRPGGPCSRRHSPCRSLTDIVAHALGLPSEIKQDLLAETRVDRRVATCWKILRQVADQSPALGPRAAAVPAPIQHQLARPRARLDFPRRRRPRMDTGYSTEQQSHIAF